MTLPPRPSILTLAWAGFRLGLLAVLVLVACALFLGMLISLPVWFMLAMGFGQSGFLTYPLLALLVLGGLAVGFLWWIWRRMPTLLAQCRGIAGWTAAAAGILLAVAGAVIAMPADIEEMVVWTFTGEDRRYRESLPATDEERQRLQEVVRADAVAGNPAAQFEYGLALRRGAWGAKRDRDAGIHWLQRSATHPQGVEASIVLALDQRAEPTSRYFGRTLISDDGLAQVAALRVVRSSAPPEWQSVLNGTITQIHRASFDVAQEEQATREALVDQVRGQSRAVAIAAACIDEENAERLRRKGNVDQALALWRRAFQQYAAAGATFEVLRLREDVFEYGDNPVPAPLMPSSIPSLKDAAVAERLWRFAWMLDSDGVHARTAPGQTQAARVAAMVAMERSPDPSVIASIGPARQIAAEVNASGRWVLALHHARGICEAALMLSRAVANRRDGLLRRDGDNLRDHAWAFAWAERAEACARTDAARDSARQQRRIYELLANDAATRDAARDGVEQTIAGLR